MDEAKRKKLVAYLEGIGYSAREAERISNGPENEKERTYNQTIRELEKNIEKLKTWKKEIEK